MHWKLNSSFGNHTSSEIGVALDSEGSEGPAPELAAEASVPLEKRTFFSCPSVHQSNVSAVGTTRSGRADVLKPRVYSAEVSEYAHAQLIEKSRQKVLYFDTNRGSKVVQPRSFSHAPGSEWCVRVPDPTSGRTSTKRSHNLA